MHNSYIGDSRIGSSHIGDSHVVECLLMAADAERRAFEVSNAQSRADNLLMASRWYRLAQSYQLVDRLEQFLVDVGQ